MLVLVQEGLVFRFNDCTSLNPRIASFAALEGLAHDFGECVLVGWEDLWRMQQEGNGPKGHCVTFRSYGFPLCRLESTPSVAYSIGKISSTKPAPATSLYLL